MSHPDLGGRIWQNPGEIPGNGIDDDHDGHIDDVNGLELHGHREQPASTTRRRRQPRHARGRHHRGPARQRLRRGRGRRQRPHHAAQVPDARTAATRPTRSRRSSTPWRGAPRSSTRPGAATSYSPALCDAIAAGRRAGRPVRRRGGQRRANNDATPTWPANCPAATLVAVAATTSADGLAPFSNYGPASVDVGAPGGHDRQHPPGVGVRLQVGHLDGRPARHRHRRRGARAAPGPHPRAAAVGGGLGRPEHPGPGGDHGLRPARGPAGRHLGGRRRRGAGRDAPRGVLAAGAGPGARDPDGGPRLPLEPRPATPTAASRPTGWWSTARPRRPWGPRPPRAGRARPWARGRTPGRSWRWTPRATPAARRRARWWSTAPRPAWRRRPRPRRPPASRGRR